MIDLASLEYIFKADVEYVFKTEGQSCRDSGVEVEVESVEEVEDLNARSRYQ